jgi:hypothetical protein
MYDNPCNFRKLHGLLTISARKGEHVVSCAAATGTQIDSPWIDQSRECGHRQLLKTTLGRRRLLGRLLSLRWYRYREVFAVEKGPLRQWCIEPIQAT